MAIKSKIFRFGFTMLTISLCHGSALNQCEKELDNSKSYTVLLQTTALMGVKKHKDFKRYVRSKLSKYDQETQVQLASSFARIKGTLQSNDHMIQGFDILLTCFTAQPDKLDRFVQTVEGVLNYIDLFHESPDFQPHRVEDENHLEILSNVLVLVRHQQDEIVFSYLEGVKESLNSITHQKHYWPLFVYQYTLPAFIQRICEAYHFDDSDVPYLLNNTNKELLDPIERPYLSVFTNLEIAKKVILEFTKPKLLSDEEI